MSVILSLLFFIFGTTVIIGTDIKGDHPEKWYNIYLSTFEIEIFYLCSTNNTNCKKYGSFTDWQFRNIHREEGKYVLETNERTFNNSDNNFGFLEPGYLFKTLALADIGNNSVRIPGSDYTCLYSNFTCFDEKATANVIWGSECKGFSLLYQGPVETILNPTTKMKLIRFIQEIYNIKFVFSLKILNKTKCSKHHLEIYNTDQKNVVVELVEKNESFYRYPELIQHLRPVDLLNPEDSSSTEIPDAEKLNTKRDIESEIELVKKFTLAGIGLTSFLIIWTCLGCAFIVSSKMVLVKKRKNSGGEPRKRRKGNFEENEFDITDNEMYGFNP
ncbi:hypothetical protein JTB14_011212 [Gonioctena quinquepunctata]|nr:hypothetical protein JTB14_011212 [Gonioctena quinquepunctata]